MSSVVRWMQMCNALTHHLGPEFGMVAMWDGDLHGTVTKQQFVDGHE